MFKERKETVAALEKLVAEVRKERKLEYARFTNRLTWHAQTEEEVYYPAAILIDEYLKPKLARADAEMSMNSPSTKKTRTQKGKRKQWKHTFYSSKRS